MNTFIIATDKLKSVADKMARGIFASLIGMFVMVCSGCGGGGDSGDAQTPAAPPSPTAVVTRKTVEIDYYGDSTIWGSTPFTGAQLAVTPPMQLASELTRRCGFAVKVNNLAVPGTWATQLLYPSAPYQMQSFAMRMASSTAQVVIPGGFGLNDAASSDLESYSNAMREMIRIGREAGKIVAVETSIRPSWGDGPAPTIGWHGLVGAMAASLRIIAAETGTPLIEQYTTTPSTVEAIPDGLHPSQAVSIQKANRVADIVQQLICHDSAVASGQK